MPPPARRPFVLVPGNWHRCQEALAFLECSWRANRSFFLTFGLYAVAALLAASYWRIPISLQLYSDAFFLFGAAIAVLAFSVIATKVMLEKPAQPLAAVASRLHEHQLRQRLVVGVPVAIALPVFFSLFTSLKGGISRIVPFYADASLIAVDRAIHGADPWRIIQPVVGFPIVTFALNLVYNLWFIVMMMVLFCVTFMIGDERLRSRYLVAFVLAWAFLGNLCATIFSSVGPCFYSYFGGEPLFSELMAYLHGVDARYPVWALDAQSTLLASAQVDGPRLGSGISAFPSMHVAVATLNGIVASRFGRVWRGLAWAFFALISIGSVALAWHYAVDAYFSVAGVYAIWRLSDRIVGSDESRKAVMRGLAPGALDREPGTPTV